jgi:hypothetical protein
MVGTNSIDQDLRPLDSAIAMVLETFSGEKGMAVLVSSSSVASSISCSPRYL